MVEHTLCMYKKLDLILSNTSTDVNKQIKKGKNKGERKLNKSTTKGRGLETSVIKARKEQETKMIW